MFVPNADSMGFSGCLICLSKSTRRACVKRSLFAPHQPEARGDRASLATGKPQKVGRVNIVDHSVRIGVTGDIDSGQPSCPLVAAELEAFLDPQIEAQVVGGGTPALCLEGIRILKAAVLSLSRTPAPALSGSR